MGKVFKDKDAEKKWWAELSEKHNKPLKEYTGGSLLNKKNVKLYIQSKGKRLSAGSMSIIEELFKQKVIDYIIRINPKTTIKLEKEGE